MKITVEKMSEAYFFTYLMAQATERLYIPHVDSVMLRFRNVSIKFLGK